VQLGSGAALISLDAVRERAGRHKRGSAVSGSYQSHIHLYVGGSFLVVPVWGSCREAMKLDPFRTAVKVAPGAESVPGH
jgi:urease accessory protein UreH